MDGIYSGTCGHRISKLEDVKSLHRPFYGSSLLGSQHSKVSRGDGSTKGTRTIGFLNALGSIFGYEFLTNHVGWRFRGEVIVDGIDEFCGLQKLIAYYLNHLNHESFIEDSLSYLRDCKLHMKTSVMSHEQAVQEALVAALIS